MRRGRFKLPTIGIESTRLPAQDGVCLRRATRFAPCCDGVAAIDYALLAGLVALAAVGAFRFMGVAVSDMFNAISSDFSRSMPQGG